MARTYPVRPVSPLCFLLTTSAMKRVGWDRLFDGVHGAPDGVAGTALPVHQGNDGGGHAAGVFALEPGPPQSPVDLHAEAASVRKCVEQRIQTSLGV